MKSSNSLWRKYRLYQGTLPLPFVAMVGEYAGAVELSNELIRGKFPVVFLVSDQNMLSHVDIGD
jgi:hypothetical protein